MKRIDQEINGETVAIYKSEDDGSLGENVCTFPFDAPDAEKALLTTLCQELHRMFGELAETGEYATGIHWTVINNNGHARAEGSLMDRVACERAAKEITQRFLELPPEARREVVSGLISDLSSQHPTTRPESAPSADLNRRLGYL